MVVAPEPSVKGARALARVLVDRTVGPATQERADEALCLAVGLRPVGASAQMANPQRPTSDRVDRRAIARAVVGQQLLDAHAVALEELHGTAKEANHRDRLLVAEYLGIGQTGAVVDRDVHVLPADLSPVDAGGIALDGVAAFAPVDAMPGATLGCARAS